MLDDYGVRFAGVSRLLGAAGLERLRRVRVAVVGLGGVGSWAVEALARSGVGSLVLVDLDEVCLSNVNRQLPAVTETVGRFKAEVLADRVRAIQPQCEVRAVTEFFTEASADRVLGDGLHAVIDAIDVVGNKSRLLAACRQRRLPVVSCGAAGGRLDPTQVKVADLARVTHDRLLAAVRGRLRRCHGFPRGKEAFEIPCVYSPESPVKPVVGGRVCGSGDEAEEEGGGRAPRPLRLGCDWGYGSAVFVTGAFGLAAAGWVIRQLSGATGGPSDGGMDAPKG